MKRAIYIILLIVISVAMSSTVSYSATVDVMVGSFFFNEKDVVIKVGDTVRWVGQGGLHTSTSGANCTPDGNWDSGNLTSGGTFERIFNEPGTFPYHCRISNHCSFNGMEGTVTVVNPDITISPASGTYVSTQAFDAVLIITAPGLTITGGSATLNSVDITSELIGCLVPGTLVTGGETFRCPGLTGGAFGTGSQSFSVTIDLSDGSSISDSVTWEVVGNAEP